VARGSVLLVSLAIPEIDCPRCAHTMIHDIIVETNCVQYTCVVKHCATQMELYIVEEDT
jgi:hypothetical protein